MSTIQRSTGEMSKEEQISRKEKKALRDAERQKKSKKRKAADVEEVDADEAIEPVIEGAVVEQDAEPKKSKKTKKRKSGALEQEAESTKPAKTKKRKADSAEDTADGAHAVVTDATSRPRKRSKSTKAGSNGAVDGTQPTEAVEKTTKSRFIVFVGNLPYKTTDDSLRKHFQNLEPFTLRHRTDPSTKKSKGFAFLEFENFDRMKTCLKLYHHSTFDPTEREDEPAATKGKGKHARKINVELTSGGGGNTEGRKEKIKAKNVRLEEQRKRRAEAERKEKARKEAKEGRSGGKDVKAEEVAVVEEKAPATDEDSHGMHPSRLARLQR